MDRRRRAAALKAPGRSRARVVPATRLLLGVVVLVSLTGCRNGKEEARQREEMMGALQRFMGQVADLQRQSSALRARFDKLPQDLPDIEPVREDLHTLEEVIGVEDGRTKWLSLELERAFASGQKEQVDAVARTIPRSTSGLEQVVVKVMHELLPLERVAGQRRYFESLDARRGKPDRP